ncbi:MAG: aldehyde ferredoxin oxidoreductase family protein [Spirochaetales bacterium]|nr:aldehyde ferredoxin oxidoreductase family protein [Spirochaetales bacterium]
MKGYNGRYLDIDLSAGTVEVKPLSEDMVRQYIGGSGLGAKFLYDATGPDTDPLGPENIMIFASGPVTSTGGFNSDRFEVVSKSPQSGIYGEASCGGKWGGRFKKTGYDAMIVRGKATSPVYITITDKDVKIEDASDLWGLDTFKTHRQLKEAAGKGAEVACIGPSGEKMIRIAAIIADGAHGRAAGRCGLGAVMGSKNLKAVVVNGNTVPEIADAGRIKEINKSLNKSMKEDAACMREAGTTCALDYFEEIGNLPIRNWYQGNWPEGAENLKGYTTVKTHKAKRYACGNCPIACGKIVKAKDGPYDGEDVAAPEYETVGLMGSNLMIDDYDIVVKENELCNRYGIDTIAAGNTIAAAMEAFERGIISLEDTDGIELRFGDGQAAIQALEKMCKREGRLGELLCDGSRSFAEKVGPEVNEFIHQVKGLEFPAHDPRANFSLALAYATSNRGACHLSFTQDYEETFVENLGVEASKGRFSPEKAAIVARMQDWSCLFDSLCICKFARYGGLMLQQTLDYLNASTGWDMDMEDFLKAGERIFNLKRLYNQKHGISRKDDTLPPRILTHRRGGGTNELPPLNVMLSDYYDFRGWDEMGRVTAKKLNELDIVSQKAG